MDLNRTFLSLLIVNMGAAVACSCTLLDPTITRDQQLPGQGVVPSIYTPTRVLEIIHQEMTATPPPSKDALMNSPTPSPSTTFDDETVSTLLELENSLLELEVLLGSTAKWDVESAWE